MIQNINSLNAKPAGIQEKSAPAGEQKFVDLSDGVNDALEISLLPMMDTFVWALSDRCSNDENGNPSKWLSVQNSVSQMKDGEYTQIMDMKYVMQEANGGGIDCAGSMQDLQNGHKIHLYSNATHCYDSMGVGTLLQDREREEKGVDYSFCTIRSSDRQGGYKDTHVSGRVGPYYINKFEGDLFFSQDSTLVSNLSDKKVMEMNGNIAGVPFYRSAKEVTVEKARFEGNFANKDEVVEVTGDEKNGFIINRTFGDYKVSQKIDVMQSK